MHAVDLRLPASTSEDELLAKIAELNADDEVDALLVQLPLPGGIDEERVIRAIDPDKDVDGLHPVNAGELLQGRPRLVPATARGVLALLREYDVELDGRGGGRRRPQRDRRQADRAAARAGERDRDDLPLPHARPRDATRVAADVLVVATGRPRLVTADMVKPGAAVIDVGINRTDDGPRRRRRSGRRRGRRTPHAGAGRRRADDDRMSAWKTPSFAPACNAAKWAVCNPLRAVLCSAGFAPVGRRTTSSQ